MGKRRPQRRERKKNKREFEMLFKRGKEVGKTVCAYLGAQRAAQVQSSIAVYGGATLTATDGTLRQTTETDESWVGWHTVTTNNKQRQN